MVMAQSLFIALKQRYPECLIDVLAPEWTLPLLDPMPEVAHATEIPLKRGGLGLGVRYRLGRELRCNKYDQAILLPNSLKSAFIPFFAGIPKRTGYVGEARWGLLNDPRRLDKKILPKTVQRFVALAEDQEPSFQPDCPEPRLVVGGDEIRTIEEKFDLSSFDGKVLGLCPGAEYGPAKRWPERYYAAVAEEKIRAGWNVWLFGSAKDQTVCDEINRATGQRCRGFAGKTSLGEAIGLLSLTDSVVTNDSGLMHVAAALGKNLIALYGSSDPGFTPPLTQKARIVSLGLECSPCFARECPLGHFRCMNEIDPAQVIASLDGL